MSRDAGSTGRPDDAEESSFQRSLRGECDSDQTIDPRRQCLDVGVVGDRDDSAVMGRIRVELAKMSMIAGHDRPTVTDGEGQHRIIGD